MTGAVPSWSKEVTLTHLCMLYTKYKIITQHNHTYINTNYLDNCTYWLWRFDKIRYFPSLEVIENNFWYWIDIWLTTLKKKNITWQELTLAEKMWDFIGMWTSVSFIGGNLKKLLIWEENESWNLNIPLVICPFFLPFVPKSPQHQSMILLGTFFVYNLV